MYRIVQTLRTRLSTLLRGHRPALPPTERTEPRGIYQRAKNNDCDVAHSLPLANAAYEGLCFLFFLPRNTPEWTRLGSLSFVCDGSTTSCNIHGQNTMTANSLGVSEPYLAAMATGQLSLPRGVILQVGLLSFQPSHSVASVRYVASSLCTLDKRQCLRC